MPEHNAMLRYGSLALLVAQDTALVLLLRSSREGSSDRPMYLASTAVLIMEVIKLNCCNLMIFQGEAAFNISDWYRIVSKDVLNPYEMLKLSVPALLYLVQNNLLYFALSHLRATPYKVRDAIRITSCFIV